MKHLRPNNHIATLVLVFLLLLVACQPSPPPVVEVTEEKFVEEPTAEPAPPTPTVTEPEPTPTTEPTDEPTATVQQEEPEPAPLSPMTISYIEDGDPMQTLDVYVPAEGEGPWPTLFVVPGRLDDKTTHRSLAEHFIEQDHAVVVTDYPQPDGASQPFALNDTFCSLAWVHKNAETYGFDTEQIVVFGYDMGGHIASSLGTVDDPSSFLQDCPHTLPASDWVKGVVTFAGVFSTPEFCLVDATCMFWNVSYNQMSLPQMTAIVEALLQLSPDQWLENSDLDEDAKRYARALPLSWLDGSEPPFLIIHGTEDEDVPTVGSEAFAKRLDEAGVAVQLMLIPGAGHQSIYPSSPSFATIADAIAALLASE